MILQPPLVTLNRYLPRRLWLELINGNFGGSCIHVSRYPRINVDLCGWIE